MNNPTLLFTLHTGFALHDVCIWSDSNISEVIRKDNRVRISPTVQVRNE